MTRLLLAMVLLTAPALGGKHTREKRSARSVKTRAGGAQSTSRSAKKRRWNAPPVAPEVDVPQESDSADASPPEPPLTSAQVDSLPVETAQAPTTAIANDATTPETPPSLSSTSSGFFSNWKDLGVSFRVAGLFLQPLGRSREVELTNISWLARLGASEGPVSGSGIGMGNALMPVLSVGYSLPWVERRVSLETVLGLPFTMKLSAQGTLANESLAPRVLGLVNTGLPALGPDLGEATVLPPVLTAVARLFPRGARVNPYLGLGAALMVTLNARVTNPILTEVRAPIVDIPAKWGWVLQTGVDVQLYRRFFLTADFKYIGGLDLEARVRDIYVRLPNISLLDSVHVGDTVARVSVDPIAVQLGVGMNL